MQLSKKKECKGGSSRHSDGKRKLESSGTRRGVGARKADKL